MLTIFRKELYSFFSNATAYIVIGIFLLLTSLFLWVFPGQYNIPDSGYANVDGLFYFAPWLFLFLCPAVSMHMIAEEKRSGTWELMLTRPLHSAQIVMAKYLAALVLVLIALFPTLIYYFSVSYIAEPQGNIDAGGFWGSFIGLIMLAAVYLSIGIFASSITKNQLVSFVAAVGMSFFMLYGFELVALMLSSVDVALWVDSLGIHAHYKSMSRGVIDSLDLAYFLVVISAFLVLTVMAVDKSKR